MARLSVATRRFASAENRHGMIVCSTSGSTHAASISRTRLSSPRLSDLCFAGTKTDEMLCVFIRRVDKEEEN
jgi:hypothetical protein